MAKKALVLVENSTRSTGLLYIQAAQRLGLRPIILSADPTRYDYLETKEIEANRVDTDNLDLLIAECSRLSTAYGIAGITSAWEPSYATVGKLCRYFSLPGPNPASIEQCCDKSIQRQLLADNGIPIPAYRVAANEMDIQSAAATIGLPVVVKPAVGYGSSGVRLCRNGDELAEHTTSLLGGRHNGHATPRILIEEFAQGPHYTAHLMGSEVIGIAAGDFGRPPHFVFRNFAFPAQLPDDQYGRIVDVSLRCLRALGLGWGPTNIEFRWTKRGPMVIEVNPRLSGAPDPQLVQLAYGVDLITEHIRLAIGDEWSLRRGRSQTAAARILVPDRDGILDEIAGVSRAAAVPGVVEVRFYVKPKTPIVRKGDYRDWIGHIIAASPTLAQTDAILQQALDLIHWSVTPFQSLNE